MEITKSKTERGTKNMITAQVRSGATVQQTKQPYRAERLRCDSYAQDCYGANSRLSWEKNHGAPSVKVCSKLCGRSTAQGGHRIRLRPQWPGVIQRRPHTQASPNQISRKVIAWRIKDTTEKPNRESIWIALNFYKDHWVQHTLYFSVAISWNREQ